MASVDKLLTICDHESGMAMNTLPKAHRVEATV